MNSPIEEIKNRLNILEVAKDYVKLEKSGVNYRGLCPFHSEKTPSFFVNPTRQIWHCFGGCGEGGDIFKLIMKIEGIEFGDALRLLAQKAGIELKKQDPKIQTEREKTYDICELATQFFQKQLSSNIGERVKEYLNKRGIKNEAISFWRIGYAPDSWNDLLSFLLKKGYSYQEIEKAGLIIKKDGENKYYDRFRKRIIFPVFDLNSNPIGFGGRIFESIDEKKEAKYLNTPNTILYDKSKVLYGLNNARVEARKKDFFILVEGYTDAIMAHQSGNLNTVSTSGTALTLQHLDLLERYTKNLVTAFDMDLAGDSATKKGIDLAQSQEFNIKVTSLPQGLDPADLILKDVNLWKKAIEKPVSITEFYFQNTFLRYDSKTPEGKKDIAKILLPVILKIPNDIEKDFWIQELSKKLLINKEAILEEFKKVKKTDNKETKEIIEEKKDKKNRKELLEEQFLLLSFKNKEYLNKLSDEERSFFSNNTLEIIDFLNQNNLSNLPDKIKNKVNYLLMKSEIEEIDKMTEKDIIHCLAEIKAVSLKEKLNKLSIEIKEAEFDNNHERSKILETEFNDLCQKLRNVQLDI